MANNSSKRSATRLSLHSMQNTSAESIIHNKTLHGTNRRSVTSLLSDFLVNSIEVLCQHRNNRIIKNFIKNINKVYIQKSFAVMFETSIFEGKQLLHPNYRGLSFVSEIYEVNTQISQQNIKLNSSKITHCINSHSIEAAPSFYVKMSNKLNKTLKNQQEFESDEIESQKGKISQQNNQVKDKPKRSREQLLDDTVSSEKDPKIKKAITHRKPQAQIKTEPSSPSAVAVKPLVGTPNLMEKINSALNNENKSDKPNSTAAIRFHSPQTVSGTGSKNQNPDVHRSGPTPSRPFTLRQSQLDQITSPLSLNSLTNVTPFATKRLGQPPSNLKYNFTYSQSLILDTLHNIATPSSKVVASPRSLAQVVHNNNISGDQQPRFKNASLPKPFFLTEIAEDTDFNMSLPTTLKAYPGWIIVHKKEYPKGMITQKEKDSLIKNLQAEVQRGAESAGFAPSIEIRFHNGCIAVKVQDEPADAWITDLNQHNFDWFNVMSISAADDLVQGLGKSTYSLWCPVAEASWSYITVELEAKLQGIDIKELIEVYEVEDKQESRIRGKTFVFLAPTTFDDIYRKCLELLEKLNNAPVTDPKMTFSFGATGKNARIRKAKELNELDQIGKTRGNHKILDHLSILKLLLQPQATLLNLASTSLKYPRCVQLSRSVTMSLSVSRTCETRTSCILKTTTAAAQCKTNRPRIQLIYNSKRKVFTPLNSNTELSCLCTNQENIRHRYHILIRSRIKMNALVCFTLKSKFNPTMLLNSMFLIQISSSTHSKRTSINSINQNDFVLISQVFSFHGKSDISISLLSETNCTANCTHTREQSIKTLNIKPNRNATFEILSRCCLRRHRIIDESRIMHNKKNRKKRRREA